MRTTISLTVLMLMSFVLSGCGRGPAATATPEADSLQALHNDSLIWLAKSTADKERAFYVIDSIERAGGIGPIRANYERGNVCRQLKEQRQSEDYWKTAVGTDIKGKAEEKAYYKAVAYLANWLQAKHDFEGALRVAIPAVARMKQSGVASYTSIGIHMGDMGICHQKMNRNAEADRCFEESYDYMKKAVATDTSQYAIENALIILNNTTLFCMDARRYDKALHWSACVDSMLQAYRQNPNANQRVLALQEARRLNCLACILLGQGKKKEAEETFVRYQQSEAYQKGWHHAPGEYLIAAGRYAEAAGAYADIENEIAQRVGKPTLDIIQQYVFPKFRANAGAGYKDTAVAVGLRMVDALDSAIARQKKDEAAELSAIYETQEKDHQIAEQKAAISQQRLVTTSIVAAIVVLALVIFIFFRHRAAVRLENEHHKLLDAYDRLEETTTAKERIESELRIARDIQMSMVPKEFPQRDDLDMYASMVPAKEVGGDLYGYVLQDDKLYFCVGDVSGKGVPASLFMAQVTRLFRTLATQGMKPADICNRMNAALTEDNEQGMFVTLFLGLLDLQTGHLDYCNAGHNPPVIGGGEAAGEFMEMEPNAPIGLWPGLDYVGEEMATIKGRPLFIYTDGLNEAEDPQQQQYGDERLLATLQRTHYERARQVIDTLTAEIERHRAGAEPNDDLTMMCIHLKTTSAE